MVILDSNIWIALLNTNDSNHQKAVKIFKGISKSIILPEYVLLETVTILCQEVDKRTADEFIKYTANNKDIEIYGSSVTLLHQITNFYLSQKNEKLSFVDYSLLYFSQKMRVETLDVNLKKEINQISKLS
ncbi:PIN domain-containing protein [Candidatus Azambacteria bacterium]|nr:PIN domain-containing protein [Candidatus Azambacteria bacterium]